MNSEPFFLVDEELENFQGKIKGLMFELRYPKEKKKAMFLREFTKACALSFKKPEYKPSFLPPEIEKPRVEKIVKKIPVGYSVWPIPKPHSEKLEDYRAKRKYREIKIEKVIPASHRELIIDRFTEKPLATAEANEKYVVNEPKLKKEHVMIIRKILEIHPKDMKTAWELIKKEGLNDEDATKVKYYVANELFAFGKIEPLLHDPEVKAIICDGVGESIKVKYRGKELRTNFVFKDKEILDNYVYNIARKLGKELSEGRPVLDTVHKGFRIQLILGIRTSSKFVFKRIE